MRRFEEALPIALLRTREVVMARFRPHLAEYGMTEQQWRLIRVVQQRPGIDATALSEACCILMPSLSRMLKNLETDGLLTRKKVEGDMRRQVISLTKQGKDLFAKMAPKAEAIYAQMEAEFGKSDMSDLIGQLQTLRRSLK
ncbi:MAG: homoprotocatechuate degradation operon regulator HpaR [Rhizobiaceae bacterium]|nr:homoprotocatechuate degradation operon regulator HpaR [Rhizobiaceae bacterium]